MSITEEIAKLRLQMKEVIHKIGILSRKVDSKLTSGDIASCLKTLESKIDQLNQTSDNTIIKTIASLQNMMTTKLEGMKLNIDEVNELIIDNIKIGGFKKGEYIDKDEDKGEGEGDCKKCNGKIANTEDMINTFRFSVMNDSNSERTQNIDKFLPHLHGYYFNRSFRTIKMYDIVVIEHPFFYFTTWDDRYLNNMRNIMYRFSVHLVNSTNYSNVIEPFLCNHYIIADKVSLFKWHDLNNDIDNISNDNCPITSWRE